MHQPLSLAQVAHLRRKAKTLAQALGVPLHEAQKQVAMEKGFRNWSLLVKAPRRPPAQNVEIPAELNAVVADDRQSRRDLALLFAQRYVAPWNQVAEALGHTPNSAQDFYLGLLANRRVKRRPPAQNVEPPAQHKAVAANDRKSRRALALLIAQRLIPQRCEAPWNQVAEALGYTPNSAQDFYLSLLAEKKVPKGPSDRS